VPLFAPDERVASGRVGLSALQPEGLDSFSDWLTAALAPDWHPDDLCAAVEAGHGVRFSDQQGDPIGLAVVLLDLPVKGAASLPFVAVAPSRRFRGLGGEAALALERHLRVRHGVERLFAPVPDGRGLAVYFWLRLGYRPLSLRQAPGPLVGLTSEARPGIWLLREEP
jgi:hypothetical protein